MTPEISIILPCLNEETAIGHCLDQIQQVMFKNHLRAEIILVDNGSTDQSHDIALSRHVQPVMEMRRGYGYAYLKGFETAQGQYWVLADVDGTYDFEEIPRFVEKLKSGFDLVLGNRFQGTIEPGAMPWRHQYLGTPLLSWLMHLFFKTKIRDTQCGMRALTREAAQKLNLKTTGMEFASEMIIKAAKKKLRISEVPIHYRRRLGRSKLKSVSDGWRHLRFMLLHRPLILFFIPGLILFLIGMSVLLLLYFGSLSFFHIRLQYHPMTFASVLSIIGYQLIVFSLFAKTYTVNHLGDEHAFDNFYTFLTVENVSLAGLGLCLSGLGLYGAILIKWISLGFGELHEIKNAIMALTLTTIGMQTIFSSWMLSILDIKEK